jgi:ATP-binding cassette subfamily B protein
VAWDGVDITAYDAHSVAGRVAVCPQDPNLWPISARANIGVCEPEAGMIDEGLVHAAAAASGAAEVIEELTHGYDTILSPRFTNGTELSGGQRAKVAVARGIYQAGSASVLVLDEPTANLDPIAEAETYRSIMGLRGRGDLGVVLVSHRLGAVVGADRIYVFEHGRVTESGTHEQLLELGGAYALMYGVQAQMYTVDAPLPATAADRE